MDPELKIIFLLTVGSLLVTHYALRNVGILIGLG